MSRFATIQPPGAYRLRTKEILSRGFKGAPREMTDPDLKLALKAQRGNRRSLETLYERYRGPLFGFLLRSAGQPDLAQDLYQEVWTKVLRSLDRFDPARGNFRGWLYRVASNASVDLARRRRVRAGVDLDAPYFEDGPSAAELVPSKAPGPEREGMSREAIGDLKREMALLPEGQREAVLLRHQLGLTYAEISDALNIPEGTAKSLVHRGVKTLRTALKDWSDV